MSRAQLVNLFSTAHDSYSDSIWDQKKIMTAGGALLTFSGALLVANEFNQSSLAGQLNHFLRTSFLELHPKDNPNLSKGNFLEFVSEELATRHEPDIGRQQSYLDRTYHFRPKAGYQYDIIVSYKIPKKADGSFITSTNGIQVHISPSTLQSEVKVTRYTLNETTEAFPKMHELGNSLVKWTKLDSGDRLSLFDRVVQSRFDTNLENSERWRKLVASVERSPSMLAKRLKLTSPKIKSLAGFSMVLAGAGILFWASQIESSSDLEAHTLGQINYNCGGAYERPAVGCAARYLNSGEGKKVTSKTLLRLLQRFRSLLN